MASPRPLPVVLVVDDEPMVRDLMARALQPYCRVFAAADGQEALDLMWGLGEVHAVVTDIQMPVLDGLALAARLKQMNHPPPVLFVSGHGQVTELPSPFLPKPFLPETLVTAVKGLLSRPGPRIQ
jgi:CheY-like chemotaxis protein